MTPRIFTATLAAFAAAAAPAAGQSVVVPNTPAAAGTAVAVSMLPRTYQAAYDAPMFGGITAPVRVTGMQLRLAAPTAGGAAAAWPARDLTWADYTVQMSRPSDAFFAANGFPADTGGLPATTFAQNQGADVTTVRSGPLTIAAGSYTQSGQPGQANPFGPTIGFTTPYLYTPGEVVVLTIGHSGHGTAGVAAGLLATGGIEWGSAEAVVLRTASDFTATPELYTNPLTVQFTYEPAGAVTPTPEPHAVLAAAAAAVGLARLRRHVASRLRARPRTGRAPSGSKSLEVALEAENFVCFPRTLRV